MVTRSIRAADLKTILGEELFQKLLGKDPFNSDARSKARLELILRITDNLSGSFNDEGIWRWFYRKRQGLQDKSFLSLFTEGWEAHDPGPNLCLEASVDTIYY